MVVTELNIAVDLEAWIEMCKCVSPRTPNVVGWHTLRILNLYNQPQYNAKDSEGCSKILLHYYASM